MSLTRSFLNLGSLIPLAMADLQADDQLSAPQNPRFTPGALGFYQDNYGPRWLVYVRNLSGATRPLGDVIRRIADTTVTGAYSSQTVTSIAGTGFALTAGAHVGKLLIDDVETVVGTAPEGESGVVTANTATRITIDPALPFSAAGGGATTQYRLYSPGWHGDAAGGSVLAVDVLGVVVGDNGISDKNFGWVQYCGVHPLVTPTAAAIANGALVITAATAKVATIGAAANDKVIGKCVGTIAATNNGKVPIYLRCYLAAQWA